jgi:hypothetical protein
VCAKQGVQLILYIDDFSGCASSLKQATQQFQLVMQTLVEFGVQEATHKASPPSQDILWLGFLFNTVDMTVSIPPQKLSDIMHQLYAWHSKLSAHRQQLQSLLGKLFHVSQCVLPARKFLNRMLATLRKCPQVGRVLLDDDFRKDVRWFIKFMPLTNGIYLLDQTRGPLVVIKADSCLSAGGAVCDILKQAYSFVYPVNLFPTTINICHLECVNVLAAVRLWAPSIKHKHLRVESDSATSVAVLQDGRGRDALLQAAARELWLLAALHQFTIEVVHIPGEQLLESADALSRAHTGEHFKLLADKYCADRDIKYVELSQDLFNLPMDW